MYHHSSTASTLNVTRKTMPNKMATKLTIAQPNKTIHTYIHSLTHSPKSRINKEDLVKLRESTDIFTPKMDVRSTAIQRKCFEMYCNTNLVGSFRFVVLIFYFLS